MAYGILARASGTQNTNTSVYSVPDAPDDTYAVVQINVRNGDSTDVLVRLAIGPESPSNADWIEYDVSLVPNGTLQRTGLALGAGDHIVLWTNSNSVYCQVFGNEVGPDANQI